MAVEDQPAHTPTRSADLVLEGGGVKGIALVGAAVALDSAGWRFERIAGSSAGAIVGSVIAAMQRAGEPMTRADEIMRTLDYGRMEDRRPGLRWLEWAPRVADAWGILFRLGMYQGAYLTEWLRGVLGDLGVRTFADLARDPAAADVRDRYHLVVSTSDLSRQRVLRIPWDLPEYGVDPDGFEVATAVRASAGIPFLFEPVRLRGVHGESTLADGSLLETFPVAAFDRVDDQPPRWPSIGVRLSSRASERAPAVPVTGPISMLRSLVYTTVDSTQIRHVDDPRDAERTIFAKPRGVGWTDFDLTPEQQQSLYDGGRAAALRWIARHPDGPRPTG
ncbi:patatin-like phospholipase family protein [Aeromicrobium sp. Leaf350]|uniref:patatin-like phospholipase family protein n=1 Tax=Aeromicrobium sp. Leaf350 TaxID=2876565 RepID=UPI001E52C29D|nr:patatin-like phospholipase family protein [Aeromicrobium sp. Leaf350]